MKNIGLLLFLFFCSFASNGFDKFDATVCEASTDDPTRTKCYRSAGFSNECQNEEVAKELACYRDNVHKLEPNEAGSGSTQDNQNSPLNFEIVSFEELKKSGGVVLVVNAVIKADNPVLNETNVKETLHNLFLESQTQATKKQINFDGVAGYLFQTQEHLKSGNSLGMVTWSPKGGYSLDNKENIKNKTTYEESISQFSGFGKPESVVNRLSENERKEIYREIMQVDSRARPEAEAKYPVESRHIGLKNIATYNWDLALQNNMKEYNRLREMYQKSVMEKYQISEQEAHNISIEGGLQNWSY